MKSGWLGAWSPPELTITRNSKVELAVSFSLYVVEFVPTGNQLDPPFTLSCH